jgi:hypothetical protein
MKGSGSKCSGAPVPASQADARERSARRRPSVRSRVSWPPLTVIWMS